MRFAPVGCDVYCGDYLSCNARVAEFPLGLHIWSDLNKREDRVCRSVTEGRAHGLSIQYTEAKSLSTMSVPVVEVLNYAAQPGRLLTHCSGGSCRGPTLSVLALIARGRRPHAAVRDVLTGVWDGYGVAATLPAAVLIEIFALAGCPCPWEAPPTAGVWPRIGGA
jgi:hypothetical protein